MLPAVRFGKRLAAGHRERHSAAHSDKGMAGRKEPLPVMRFDRNSAAQYSFALGRPCPAVRRYNFVRYMPDSAAHAHKALFPAADQRRHLSSVQPAPSVPMALAQRMSQTKG